MAFDEDEAIKSAIFSELKQFNLELLEFFQNPRKNPHAISKLLQLLRRSSPTSLHPFFDFTLFPLLLLLDAAVSFRSQKVSSKEISTVSENSEPLIEVSDAVAEGVICCLEELLKKCPLGSVDQMIALFKKLASAAMLLPSDASEEFREGVIRCFKALLLNLHICSDKACPCKQIGSCPMLFAEGKADTAEVFTLGSGEGECLLAFLQSEATSAAIGHWLSLLLKAADIEAARGHRGSAALRVEALRTLRVLTAKVGTADALAYFLPGVVRHIGKVLRVSKTMISGAGGSTEALDQAIRGLAEYLVIVLSDGDNVSKLDHQDDSIDIFRKKGVSAVSVLEELRHLPKKGVDQSEIIKGHGAIDGNNIVAALTDKGNADSNNLMGMLQVNRSKDWITNTSANVDKLLSSTFPHLCIHPSKKVRKGLLAAIEALLLQCSSTLKHSRLMLLECLFVLVCDDCEDVSSAAQVFLEYLLSSSEKQYCIKHDVAEIFSRLIEKIPQILLGDDEPFRVSQLQKLLVLIYFSGPKFVADQLLQSPVTAARFLDIFSLSFSQNSVFAGSLEKLVVAKPSSGYMHSIAEMNAIIVSNSEGSECSDVQTKNLVQSSDNPQHIYELPQMPPWFVHFGSKKLYEALAGILRLVGLSLFSDCKSEGSLSLVIDIPLDYLRNLVLELRSRVYSKENWQSWYRKSGAGKMVRQASTAVYILNEMMFGLSHEAIISYERMFQKSEGDYKHCKVEHCGPDESVWKICLNRGARSHLVDCIGNILHEYLSSEVWDLPVENTTHVQSTNEDREMSLHFFHDNAMLHQVIIEGIGIFNICLGKEFSLCGFLHSSLLKLLENLSCANFQVRRASDAVLHFISNTHGYPTVGHLVVSNSDYVIDSICRQLRHLDLNPQIPNVLAALLSYVGVARKVLPLLEEPMRAVSVELEILGRHQHPDLTIAFLKAVAEIAKASKHEACVLPNQSELFLNDVKSKMYGIEREKGDDSECLQSYLHSNSEMDSMESVMGNQSSGADMQVDIWESIIFKLKYSKRYRRTVGSLTGSCLAAAAPLLASADQVACLIALDIIEDGILALAKVEEAHKLEKETEEAVDKVVHLCSFNHLWDTLDAAEDATVENRLLPAMNKIWPFLIACIRQNNLVAVRRCSSVISNVVQICGGDFFSRRFHADGIHFWRILSTSPFQNKPNFKEQRSSLLLPYRSNRATLENSFSEMSDLKVQAAVLDMIAELAGNKRSASALDLVLKKISGIVVGIACSGGTGLREASMRALKGLATIDPDLVWLLVADVYYSLKKQDESLPPSIEFPKLSQILPSPLSSKGYLYMLYGEQSYGVDIDLSSVEMLFSSFTKDVQ